MNFINLWLIIKDVFPKTSMPSIEDYIKTFTPILENQEDIICICNYVLNFLVPITVP